MKVHSSCKYQMHSRHASSRQQATWTHARSAELSGMQTAVAPMGNTSCSSRTVLATPAQAPHLTSSCRFSALVPAVRLPFTWKDLNMAPKNLDKDCTPVTVDMLKQRLISPHVVDKYINKPIPGNVAPVHNTKQGYCNTYLPQDSGFARLLFVVQSFIAQGMYVVLDYQPMGLEQQAYDLNVFVDTWASLWKQVRPQHSASLCVALESANNQYLASAQHAPCSCSQLQDQPKVKNTAV